MSRLISYIFAYSDAIKDGRTSQEILTHAMTDLSELATEVQIAAGNSYKEAGSDGVVGESIDLIIRAIDMIHQVDPTITPEQLSEMTLLKLMKWRDTADK
jgi:hypothetical protein